MAQFVWHDHPCALRITVAEPGNPNNTLTYELSAPDQDGWRTVKSASGREYKGRLLGSIAVQRTGEKSGTILFAEQTVVTKSPFLKIGEYLGILDWHDQGQMHATNWPVAAIEIIYPSAA